MITSQYILDIFELAFDDHPQSHLLKNQLPFLSIRETQHTPMGIFFHFVLDSQIQPYKVDSGDTYEMIDGVEIRSADLSLHADATIHLKNGFIDHLEIWNKSGKEYPIEDPQYYEMKQRWLVDEKARIIIR